MTYAKKLWQEKYEELTRLQIEDGEDLLYEFSLTFQSAIEHAMRAQSEACAEALKAQNEEMLEVLREHEKFWRQSGCYTEEIYALQCKTQRVIAKAEV